MNFELQALKLGLERAEAQTKDAAEARLALESIYTARRGETLGYLSQRAARDIERLSAHLAAAIAVIESRDADGDGWRVVNVAKLALAGIQT